MSLTSYRAAPPRGSESSWQVGESVPARALLVFGVAFGRPGSDLLSRALRRSTIGAEGFHGRVRDGIGCSSPRHNHQVVATQSSGKADEVQLL